MKSKYGDPRTLTFSQAQGYEKLLQRLKLEELSNVEFRLQLSHYGEDS